MIRALILMIAIVVAAPLKAQDAAIQSTIQGQMNAFEAKDIETAFTYASPMIKRLFQSPQRFGAMVEQGYPMVWNQESVKFLELREIAGFLWQKVLIEDAAGTLHVLDYQMIETDEGWQINGVQVLQAPQVGA